MQCIITPFFGCRKCDLYLHRACAKRQHTKCSLHSHELKRVYLPHFLFFCCVCLQYCHGSAYHCEKCNYTIDTRCAAIKFRFKHPSHYQHPLFLHNDKRKHKCKGCGEGLKNKLVFGCEDCEFYLDARCANLPLAVRNRFDEHPLYLTFGVKRSEAADDCEYYCDVCEGERDTKEWFYYCRRCDFGAHLGDFPFVKSAKFEGHKHPLNLVKRCDKKYSVCGACGGSCYGDLAFECERLSCKFSVHAFGLCYRNQLSEGRITFTMPSLYSRSLPLHLDPSER